MIFAGLPLVTHPVDPDACLVERSLQGDREAFAALVDRHRDGLFGFARHVVGNEADAEDLAQEAFVRAYAALSRFRPGAPFEPWLYTIAANLCRSHLRRRKHRPLSLESAGEVETPAPDPASAALGAAERSRVLAAVALLPLEQRMVVVLRHLRGCSYQQIAAALRLPVSTVEHRLRAARKTLRRSLGGEEGGRHAL